MLYPVKEGEAGLERAMTKLCRQASTAVATGHEFMILSDRDADQSMRDSGATGRGGVHHHLIREGTRTQVGLVVESGEPRKVHHFALLIGYGAGAINPYLAFETLDDMIRPGRAHQSSTTTKPSRTTSRRAKGVMKVMSKMGISTAQSYCGADIRGNRSGSAGDRPLFYLDFLALSGIGLDVIAAEVRPGTTTPSRIGSSTATRWKWAAITSIAARVSIHLFNPETVHKLQFACRTGNYTVFKEYSASGGRPGQAVLHLAGSVRSEICGAAGSARGSRIGRVDHAASSLGRCPMDRSARKRMRRWRSP